MVIFVAAPRATVRWLVGAPQPATARLDTATSTVVAATTTERGSVGPARRGRKCRPAGGRVDDIGP